MTKNKKHHFKCYLNNLEVYANEIRLPGLDFRSEPIPMASIFVEPYVIPEGEPKSPKPVFSILSTKKATALLGEPGQGKSTIIKKYAAILTKKKDSMFPLLVEMNREREKIVTENKKYDWLFKRVPDLPKLGLEETKWEDISSLIELGKVCVLLDGLDESNFEAQSQVCELIGQIVETGNQVIVTSRPKTYRLSPFRDFEIFNLCGFDKNQISTFSNNVCQILSKQFSVQQELVLQHMREIIDGPGMTLAKNPMFLSFICLAVIRRQRENNSSQFPIRTTPLISECVDALVEWHREYKPNGDWPKEYTSSNVKRILAPLALESFQTNLGYIPNDKVNELIDRDRSFFLNYLEKARFLEHRDFGYFFTIETFREYFASLAITEYPDPYSVVKKNLNNQAWKNLIIYTSGSLLRWRAALIDKIVPTYVSLFVKIFDPIILILGNLFGLISGNKPLQDTTKKGSEIISKKLSTPIKKWFSNSRQSTDFFLSSILKSRNHFESILGLNLRLVSECIAETEDYPKRVAKIIIEKLFKKEKKYGFNFDFHNALKTASKSNHVYKYLLKLTLKKNKLRSKAIMALAGATSFPEVRIRLIELSRDPDSEIRNAAILPLCFAESYPEVLSRLLEIVSNIEDYKTHLNIVFFALSTVADKQEVTERLLESTRSGNIIISSTAVQSLWKAIHKPEVLALMVQLIGSKATHPLIRGSAKTALQNSASIPEVRRILLRMTYEKDVVLRCCGVNALVFAAEVPEVYDRMLELTMDEVDYVRFTANEALKRVISTPEIRECQLQLTHDTYPLTRTMAIWILEGFASEPAIKKRLLELTFDDDSYIRSAALSSLRGAASCPKVKQRILEMTQDENSTVRTSAARALGKTASDPIVLKRLLELTRDDTLDVSCASIGTLKEVTSDSKVVQVLIDLTFNNEKKRKISAIKALQTATSNPVARKRLIKLTWDRNIEIRMTSIYALEGATSFPEVQKRLLELIQNNDENSNGCLEVVKRTLICFLENKSSRRSINRLAKELLRKDPSKGWELLEMIVKSKRD